MHPYLTRLAGTEPTTMAIEAVLFDLDGTLVDTNFHHVTAWSQAFADRGHAVPAERIIPEMGKGGELLVPAILGDVGDGESEALRNGHATRFIAVAQRSLFKLTPRALPLLLALKARGIRTALATSSKKSQLRQVATSAQINLTSYFDVVVTADEVDTSKPAPDVIHAALKKLGLPANRCLMVGDTTYDVEAAKQAGVTCVGLLCGRTTSADSLRKAGAVAVYRDPGELLGHLDDVLGAVPVH